MAIALFGMFIAYIGMAVARFGHSDAHIGTSDAHFGTSVRIFQARTSFFSDSIPLHRNAFVRSPRVSSLPDPDPAIVSVPSKSGIVPQLSTPFAPVHETGRKFNAEDQRSLENLSTFAASAYHVLSESGTLNAHLSKLPQEA